MSAAAIDSSSSTALFALQWRKGKFSIAGDGMTFIHGYLLGGLILAGVPVLLHLLMRQKPRRLSFPAFRFLRAKQRANQRKIRLQHLLLLLLRMAVVAALCLALARPRIFAER